MINRFSVIFADGTDPKRNLALESALLDCIEEDEVMLYLWQNEKTIVIGRNQNLYREINMKNIRKDGVTPVRRPSGGGAVYHDSGNLNFTFLAYDENYDQKKHSQIICRALEKTGIHAQISGRNDMTVNGRKFSGSAYYHHGGKSFHHGTLLVDSDLNIMNDYLSPDILKLRSNSVSSVRSRVINLKELCPSLTVEVMQKLLIESAEEKYELPALMYPIPSEAKLESYYSLYSSDEWIFSHNPAYDISFENRFAWGSLRMELRIKENRIEDVIIWSDCLDPDSIDLAEAKLKGAVFQPAEIRKALSAEGNNPVISDIAEWLSEEV